MGNLTGRHALVTGGGTGIGAAIARALVDAGASVTVAGRRTQPLETMAKTHPGMAVAVGDVTSEDSVAEIFATARAAHGPVTIVIANAGMVESASLPETTLDLWTRTLAVNLTGAFLTAREGLGDMRDAGWGRIVFIASTAALEGHAYVAAYCAAKHGVLGLARALAKETVDSEITVNTICPGYTETPMLEATVANIVSRTGRVEEDVRAFLAASNPVGRFVQPEEVAAAVLRIAEEREAKTNGQVIPIPEGAHDHEA